MKPAFFDFPSEHRAKSVPLDPSGFMADIDAALEKKLFELTERQRIADVHHHRETNDLE
jgi:hypothetical protein